jgi:hypothetical protein
VLAGPATSFVGNYANGGVAYDEGIEVPYLAVHDGTGEFWTLFFGWLWGSVFWGITTLLKTIRQPPMMRSAD